MSNSIKFEDHSDECKESIRDMAIKWLYECGMSLVAQVKNIYRTDTGATKGSFDYIVDEGALECTIGSPMENAIWEEFGTGLFAENGNGRKTPWKYKDRKGKWHTTTGKTSTKAFRRSFDIKKKEFQDRLDDLMKGLR